MGRYLSKIVASLLLLCGIAAPAFAQSAVVMPVPKMQFLDANGNPYASGKLYSYAAGTTTPLETCADSSLSGGACVTANANPVILDSAGRASVFLRPAVYKFILQTSASVQVYSADNVTSTTYLGSGTASTTTFLRGDFSWAKPQTFVTTSAVGTQNNFDPGIVGNTVIRCANASALTITGFPAGYDGQILWVLADLAQVNFSHVSGLSTSGNRLTNFISGTTTPMAGPSSGTAGGSAVYQYVSGLGTWRMLTHEQGPWITYTPVFSQTTTQPTTDNSTITGSYYVKGRTVVGSLSLTVGSTTAFGTGAFLLTLPPLASAAAGGTVMGFAAIRDNSVPALYTGVTFLATTTQFSVINSDAASAVGVTQAVPMTWAVSDTLRVTIGPYETP